MNAWSNIEVSREDPEIRRINEMERAIRQLDPHIRRIRELITRFEVCHFKYLQHIENIRDSILNLKPAVNPDRIGETHIRSGKDAALRDGTGRSALALKYIRALREWLDLHTSENTGRDEKEIQSKVTRWLGERDPEKERLVQLLIARMTWDWVSYGKLEKGERHKELAWQCRRMDTCHYCFPENLDSLLRGIGELKPVENFEGCGSCNSETRESVEREFTDLSKLYRPVSITEPDDSGNTIQAWLLACMLKTLKEQAGLDRPFEF